MNPQFNSPTARQEVASASIEAVAIIMAEYVRPSHDIEDVVDGTEQLLKLFTSRGLLPHVYPTDKDMESDDDKDL
jgi:hypothetical protein